MSSATFGVQLATNEGDHTTNQKRFMSCLTDLVATVRALHARSFVKSTHQHLSVSLLPSPLDCTYSYYHQELKNVLVKQ